MEIKLDNDLVLLVDVIEKLNHETTFYLFFSFKWLKCFKLGVQQKQLGMCLET